MTSQKDVETLNTKAVVCHFNQHKFIIQKRYQKGLRNQLEYMAISRKNGVIEIKRTQAKTIQQAENLTESRQVQQYGFKRQFSALIGIITLQGYKFLVFVDEVQCVSMIDDLEAYEINSLIFLPYQQEKEIKSSPKRQRIYQAIRQLSQLLKVGYYFSYSYQLTHSLQYQKAFQANKFTWNINLLEQFKLFSISKEWFVSIIQGFVGTFETIIQGNRIEYILISRRSTQKGGTRYFDRGINQQGYVANYVETEQIIKINDYKISDIQIRGNVPIFFQQKGLTTKIKLTRSNELTRKIYRKHLEKLKRTYKRIFIINLLAVQKSGQKILIQQFEKHIKQQNDILVKYMYYNFHQKVEGDHYENVDQAINQLKDIKKNFNYFVMEKDVPITYQQGVFRTNCLDCLDRTNFFQAKLSLYSLQQILRLFGISFDKNLNEIMNDPFDENSLIKKYRTIWADNGDAISWHYTGTGSTHTDITRDGKRGWMGGLKHKYKTITRFYNQNFYDFYKMGVVDMLLGKKIIGLETQKIAQMMKQKEPMYCKKSMVEVYIFSWKVPKQLPISLIVFPNTPKIIVVALQQADNIQKWKKLLNQSIDQSNYILLTQKESNNNTLIIYVHKQLKERVGNVEITRIKFKDSYYNMYFSTKCGVIIRFTIDSTKIVFVGCQLQYGKNGFNSRLGNLKQLHQKAFQQEKVGQKKSTSIINDDVIFLLGNMNTTIQTKFKDSFPQLQNLNKPLNQSQISIINKMLDTDQFSTLRQALLQYRVYEEQEINFPPTYKLQRGVYDPQKSGWPDRIWYSSQNRVLCKQYNIVPSLKSSHFPVIGAFDVQVQKIDEQAKSQIFSAIENTIENQIHGQQDLQKDNKIIQP